MTKLQSPLFTEKDQERYKSHEKGIYPDEKEYVKKSKITSYKKKFIPPQLQLI